MKKIYEYHCPHCDSSYKHDESLKRHIRNAHSENQVESVDLYDRTIFDCSYCNKNYLLKSLLINHIKKCHPEKGIYDDSDENIQYVETNISTDVDYLQLKEYVCKICKKRYSKENSLKIHIKDIHDNKFAFECNICNNVYKYKSSIQAHIKKFHSDADKETTISFKSKDKEKKQVIVNEDGTVSIKYTDSKEAVECEYCNKIYSSKLTLKVHKETQHSVQTREITPKIQCCMANCDIVVSRLYQLRKHLMSSIEDGGHDMIIEVEEKNFDNIQEFNQWKEEMEVKENKRYNVRRGTATSKNYYCSRSGNYCYKGNKKRKVQSTGTSKLDKHCPSSMNVRCNNDGSVTCTYFKTHVGHDTNLDEIMHIRIHKRDKKFIAEKLRQGIEPKKICDDLHGKGGRSAYIKVKDILNQKRILGISEANSVVQDKLDNHEIGIRDTLFSDNEEISELDSLTTENNDIEEVLEDELDDLISDSDEMDEASSLPLNNYEMAKQDSLTPEMNDREKIFKETQTTLNQLTKALNKHSNSIDYIKQMKHQLKNIEVVVNKYEEDKSVS